MKLSIKECLSFGWNTFKARPWIFVKAALLLTAVSIVVNAVSWLFEAGETAFADQAVLAFIIGLGSFIVALASIYVGIVLDNMGLIKFYLNAHDDVSGVRLKDLWAPEPLVKYVLASILLGILTIAGFILLIVPGVIVALAFGMSLYLVMDRGLGVIESMKESARITRGSRVKLFLLGLVLLLINIVGFLLALVGLLVTVPVSLLASAHAYRTLSKA